MNRPRRVALYVALGLTGSAIGLLPTIAERAAFWNLLLFVTALLVSWTVFVRWLPARRVLLALSSALLVLTVVEFVLRESRPAEMRGGPGLAAARHLPDVGFAAMPSRTTRSRLVRDGRTVYDVRYTVDENGLRVTPPAGPDPVATVVCFGCSFMFGHGVEDAESLPYRVAARAGGRARVYNFAFHGYGPHQMLALLESGRLARIVEPGGKVVGVYLAIADHVPRAAGVGWWATKGPRYVLAGDTVRREGDQRDRFPLLGWFPTLEKSEIFKRIVIPEGAGRPEDDVLFAAIVDAARRRFEALFPGGTFHALFWPDGRSEELAAMLRARGVRARPVELPPGDVMLAGDPHPNAFGHDAAAAFVVRECLGLR